MKIKVWQAVVLLLMFWLAFLGGMARAGIIEDTQSVIVELDRLATDIHDNSMQEDFWQFMPLDNFRTYLTTKEVGVKWTF